MYVLSVKIFFPRLSLS